MNILFAGSPKSSSEILDFLAKDPSLRIKGVLTQPDKKGKRGTKLYESEVARIAREHNLNIFKPKTLDCPSFVDEIKNLDIDLVIVIAYGKLIPKWLLELPALMVLNVHFSILPKYRGASPIQSSILNGDKETGISFMQMNEGLDEGGVLKTNTIRIDKGDNKITLEKKLTDLTIDNIIDVIKVIKNRTFSILNQNNSMATYCRKILKKDSITDFNDFSINIINKFRAYFDWPGLSFEFKGVQIKIHKISISQEASNGKAGSINKIDKSGIYINTLDSVIVITYLQFPNKSKISSLDVFNSYQSFFK